jgi:hypothetical protein
MVGDVVARFLLTFKNHNVMSQEEVISIDDKVLSIYEILKGMSYSDIELVFFKLKHIINCSSVLGEKAKWH